MDEHQKTPPPPGDLHRLNELSPLIFPSGKKPARIVPKDMLKDPRLAIVLAEILKPLS
jgi:hypothetical protein